MVTLNRGIQTICHFDAFGRVNFEQIVKGARDMWGDTTDQYVRYQLVQCPGDLGTVNGCNRVLSRFSRFATKRNGIDRVLVIAIWQDGVQSGSLQVTVKTIEYTYV
jgi:hypothetical protein